MDTFRLATGEIPRTLCRAQYYETMTIDDDDSLISYDTTTVFAEITSYYWQ